MKLPDMEVIAQGYEYAIPSERLLCLAAERRYTLSGRLLAPAHTVVENYE